MQQSRYEYSVFVNCPFDEEYRPVFDAIVFTCAEFGLVPEHLTFNDYVIQVEEWLTLHPPRSS